MKSFKFKKAFAGISSLCVLASAIPVSITETVSASSYLAGDATEDGTVDIDDVVSIMCYVSDSSSNPLGSQALENADVYQPGTGVNALDALSVQKYLVKTITSLPEGETTPTSDTNYIHLKNTSIETDGDNLSVDGTKVTISASGTYYVDGTLDDGQSDVNVPDETVDSGTVKIFLNGVSITGKSAPAIYIENAENTSINLVEGTENYLYDGDTAYEGDYADNAVIHAKDDLTIKGDGSLSITANNQYGIQCNNDLKFNGGDITITTESADAVRGKTSVTVKDGTIEIDSAGDGIKSTKGNVAISGGVIGIKASNDAIQAETTIDISGGAIIASGDRGLTSGTSTNITGGNVFATATDNQAENVTATQGTILLNCIDDTTATDGCWKKANALNVSGLTVSVNSYLKKYKYVLISDSQIESGKTYTLENKSTGATVTYGSDDSSKFTTSGTITTFNDVNPAGATASTGSTTTPSTGSNAETGDYTITLSGASILSNAPSDTASVSGSVVTITKPGVFAVSGTGSEVQIVVDVDKTTYPDGVVELDLVGADITNTTTAPIYVASIGDECQIVAKKGYDNTISDGTSHTQTYTDSDGNTNTVEGAIFARDDIKIKGAGNLTVNGNSDDAIICKNDIKIYNGNITVNAVDDGIRGKDSVTIGNSNDTDFSGLNLTVKASGDGIKSTNDSETGEGTITVNGGTINLNVLYDGFQAVSDITVNGGTIDIYTFDGSTYTGTSGSSSSSSWGGGGFGGGFGGMDSDGNSNKVENSAKGMKSDGTLNINGGTINIDSSDDCLHCAGDMNLIGGNLTLASADDGMHSDSNLVIGNGSANTFDDIKIYVSYCYEGVEGVNITQNSGTVVVNSVDDGYNAAGGADGSGSTTPGGWSQGGGMGQSSGNYSLNIKGGIALVNATDGDHDGFDSNGSMTISGGYVISNGNETFDTDGTLSYTGGVYVAEGSTNLTTTVSASGSASAGTRITLADSSNNVILSFIADKSVSQLNAGCNGYSSATFYTGGTISDGTLLTEGFGSQSIYVDGTISGGSALSTSSGGNSGNSGNSGWGGRG
jgi:hypothetical protein